jgi:uncharacterized protein YkwD
MRKTLKKYFIPHKENNYHPHFLHSKRTVFYGLVFLLAKVLVVAFVIFLPAEVFVLPDVLAEEQRQIIALTNETRAEKGLPALAVAPRLNTSAQNKADDMAAKQYFAHAKNNKTVATWLNEAGYDYETAGENLAVGYSTAQEIVDAWKNSPSHYANLVDTDFVDLGAGLAAGVYNGRPTVFIAEHFGSPYVAGETAAAAGKTAEKLAIAPVMNLDAQTPVDKYIQAKSVLSPITNIFEVSKNVYLAAICFFVLALLMNIFIEIRKQHPHVIFQTSGLIAMLALLWRF